MTEETEPFYGICKTSVLEAKMMALSISQDLNESGVNLGMVGKPELLADAKEIFDWMMEGMS